MAPLRYCFIVANLFLILLVQICVPNHVRGKGFLGYFLGIRPRFCKCTCGKSVQSAGASGETGKIVGGQYTSAHEYPWLVVLNIQEITIATGTLINNRFVLTSASQVLGLTPYDIKITLGAYDRCHPGVTSSNHSIDNILLHPEFSILSRANDLALLRLTNPITFERWVRPICLSKPGESTEGRTVEAVGWGVGPTEDGAQVTTCLPRGVKYPILGKKECQIRVADMGTVTSDKECIGHDSGLTTICSTDTGGPVQTRGIDGYYELVGVLPDTNFCSDNSTGVSLFTRINVHYAWLFENTKDACYCSK